MRRARAASLLPLIAGALAVAAPAAAATYDLAIVSDLGWSFRADITVRNDAPDRRIDAWALVLDWPGRTLQAPLGARMTADPQQPGRYRFEPPAGAEPLPPGGSVAFSVAGTPGGAPQAALVQLDASTSAAAALAPPPAPKGCRQAEAGLAFSTDKTWEGGYTGRIDITNKGGAPFTDWLLTFNLPGAIAESWDGTVLNHSGTAYAIKPADYFRAVAPGAAARFVFNAKAAGPQETMATPTNMRVYACG